MEGVAADGEEAELVVGGELAEANGAVEGLLGADDLPVEEDGQRVDEGLVEARVVEVEQLLELPLEGLRARDVRPRLVPIGLAGRGSRGVLLDEESHQEVEQTRDEEDHGEDYYDEEDCRAYSTAGRWRRWRGLGGGEWERIPLKATERGRWRGR